MSAATATAGSVPHPGELEPKRTSAPRGLESALAALDALLRSPGAVAARCRSDEDLRLLTLTSLAAVVVGAATFGAAVGSFRGGVQVAYAALKIPLALTATLSLCVPAFHAVAAALGRPRPARAVIALSLAAAGRSSLVLLAAAPVLWLAFGVVGYHTASLLAALAYGTAGLAALGVLLRGLEAGPGRVTTALTFVALFFAVGGQTSWLLRPYLLRPRTEDVPFVRAREGGFADAILRSSRSAAGVYEDSPRDDRRLRGRQAR